MKSETILANVRRYQMIASMYRRTAASRPMQSSSLLEQANEWENRAISEMEDYFVCSAYVQAA